MFFSFCPHPEGCTENKTHQLTNVFLFKMLIDHLRLASQQISCNTVWLDGTLQTSVPIENREDVVERGSFHSCKSTVKGPSSHT